MNLKSSNLGFLTFILYSTIGLAYWRMPCDGVVGRGLIDPIVSPNKPSLHLHSIKGASGISMNSTVDDLLASGCTSCMISQDKSAYWSPQLYFFDSDKGEFEMVPDMGHLTYYKFVPNFISNGSYVNPIAIPNGMKMVSGSALRRNMTIPNPDPPLPWTGADATQDALGQKAIGFNCLHDPIKQPNKSPEGTLQRHFLPDKAYLEENCLWGIRFEILFPTCWNGKDLDSPDHKSHLAYSDAGANGGNCPQGFDVPIMQILFETVYPTTMFIGKNGYYTLSNGDPTGFGLHGDVFAAWEGTTQEDAVAHCGNPDPKSGAFATDGQVQNCPYFSIVDTADQASCTMAATGINMNAKFQALAINLPGNNPIQSGPSQATIPGGVPGPSLANARPTNFAPSVGPIGASPSSSTSTSSSGGRFLQASPTNSVSSTTMSSSTISSTSISTPAPTLPANMPNGATIVGTTTYTSAGAVYEVVEVNVVETTTVVDANPSNKHKRHFEHLRRHREHIHNRHR